MKRKKKKNCLGYSFSYDMYYSTEAISSKSL